MLASRRPRHPVGWLLLGLGLSLNASGVASAYASYGLVARPAGLPAARHVALYLPVTVVTALACLSFVLLLTPTGSLPSPRWRWWARATAAAPVVSLLAVTLAPRPFDQPYQATENPLDLSGLSGVPLVSYQLAFAATNLAVVVGAASLVVRFRRARGSERQQLRWVALAAALALLGSVVVLAASAIEASPTLLGWVAGFYFAILPWPPPSSLPAAASSRWSTAASTGAATTPPRRSKRLAPDCATRSTSTRCRPSCSR